MLQFFVKSIMSRHFTYLRIFCQKNYMNYNIFGIAESGVTFFYVSIFWKKKEDLFDLRKRRKRISWKSKLYRKSEMERGRM